MTFPNLTGQTLVNVDRDHSLRLTTQEGWHIAIEGEELVDDKRRGAELYRAVGHPLSSFWIKDGVLSISVRDALIHAVPHPHYESWNIAGPEHQLVVCTPGGDMAVWDPVAEAPRVRRQADATTVRRNAPRLGREDTVIPTTAPRQRRLRFLIMIWILLSVALTALVFITRRLVNGL
jgi:hypothetical protein